MVPVGMAFSSVLDRLGARRELAALVAIFAVALAAERLNQSVVASLREMEEKRCTG